MRSTQKDKINYTESLAREAQDAAERGDSRTVYKITKALSVCFVNSTTVVKDKNGNTLTKNEDQLQMWPEHFQEVLNRPDPLELWYSEKETVEQATRRSFSLSFKSLGTHPALTFDIPRSRVKMRCTAEQDTPRSSAITCTVMHRSALTMSLTMSNIDVFTVAGRPWRGSSLTDVLPFENRSCHLYTNDLLQESVVADSSIISKVSYGDLPSPTQNFTTARSSSSFDDVITTKLCLVPGRLKRQCFRNDCCNNNDFSRKWRHDVTWTSANFAPFFHIHKMVFCINN